MTEPMDAAKRLGEIDNSLSDIRASERQLKNERKELEEALLGFFEEHGVQNMQIDGRTVYLYRRVTVKPKDGDPAPTVEALRKNGYGDLLRYNYQTMAALVRESDEDPDASLPPEIMNTLEVGEVFTIRSRKS